MPLPVLAQVAETAVQYFISGGDRVNVAGLVLAGSAEFKNELSESDMFDQRLRAAVLAVVDVSYGALACPTCMVQAERHMDSADSNRFQCKAKGFGRLCGHKQCQSTQRNIAALACCWRLWWENRTVSLNWGCAPRRGERVQPGH